jgi:serine/threonine protein phosphatase PrpC
MNANNEAWAVGSIRYSLIGRSHRGVSMSRTVDERIELIREAAMTEGRSYALPQGEAWVFSTPSPAREDANQDAAGIIPVNAHRALLVVADGVGGHADGAKAASLVLQHLADAVRAVGDDEQVALRSLVLDGLDRGNRAILDLGSGAATTVAVVEVDGSTVRPYHVGDAAILVTGQRGKLKYQTVPHSPVGYAVQGGWLDESEAMHHEDRHLVSNIVGSPEMHIEVGAARTLRPYDTVLLASDGLFDNFFTEELVQIMRCGAMADVVSTLRDQARRRMAGEQAGVPSKPDDLTFVVYRPRRQSATTATA